MLFLFLVFITWLLHLKFRFCLPVFFSVSVYVLQYFVGSGQTIYGQMFTSMNRRYCCMKVLLLKSKTSALKCTYIDFPNDNEEIITKYSK